MRLLLCSLVVLVGCGLDGTAKGHTARQPVLSCPTSPAKEVFTAPLCLCGDYEAVGEGLWVGGGSAGINGMLTGVGTHTFSQDVIAYGGVSGVGDVTVGGTLSTAGRVEGVGVLRVDGDLNAGSGVENVGTLQVRGTLRTPDASFVGESQVGATATYLPLVGPPCACDPAHTFDVKAAVARARDNNDNAKLGLSLHESLGEHALALGSGSYFFESVSWVGQHDLTIDGAVAIYVAGSFETVGETKFHLTSGSTLDLYIEGGLEMVGESTFGEGADPGAVRLYLGGDTPLSLVGTQRFIGAVYAPQADVELVGDSTFEGALFARNVDGVGQLRVTFGQPMVHGPDSPACQPTQTTPPTQPTEQPPPACEPPIELK